MIIVPSAQFHIKRAMNLTPLSDDIYGGIMSSNTSTTDQLQPSFATECAQIDYILLSTQMVLEVLKLDRILHKTIDELDSLCSL